VSVLAQACIVGASASNQIFLSKYRVSISERSQIDVPTVEDNPDDTTVTIVVIPMPVDIPVSKGPRGG